MNGVVELSVSHTTRRFHDPQLTNAFAEIRVP